MIRRQSQTARRRRQPLRNVVGGECLEHRHMFAGVWTPLVRSAPSSVAETMMLLTDGNVMVHTGFADSRTWAKLTPDAQGSYVNGTYSTLRSMADTRLYFPSVVLPSGKVFVIGGEYSGGLAVFTNKAEIYDPIANTWTAAASFPEDNFGDTPISLLPSGKILAGAFSSDNTYLYAPETNTWEFAAKKLRGDVSFEESWAQLPNGNVLSYDLWTDGLSAQYYDITTNTWNDTGKLPVSLTNSVPEIGAAIQLADGRIFQIGASNHTAIYDPGSNTWQAGPDMPEGIGSDDAPAAALPNGHILFVADRPSFTAPSRIYDYDPANNKLVDVSPSELVGPSLGRTPAYVTRMLMLPNGNVLFSTSTSTIWQYDPDGVSNETLRPEIEVIKALGLGVYQLTGTRINGYSEGAAYGDDAQMSTNYPIVQLTNSLGRVYYARTFNWQPGLSLDDTPRTTSFTLPAGLPIDHYQLRVIANGIASTPVNFSLLANSSVQSISPGNGATLAAPTNEFRIRFNGQIDSQSISPSALTVNGIPAGDVRWDELLQTATFTFDSSPVVQQGQQNVQLAADSILASDGSVVAGYAISFQYDAQTLKALSFSTPDGGAWIPSSQHDLVVNFSEPVDPSSIATNNLTISRGRVLAAEPMPGGTAARYRIETSNTEGDFFVSVNADSLRDQFGNLGAVGYAANYILDKGLNTQLPPLIVGAIPGAGVYSVTVDGDLRTGSDVDGYKIQLEKGQVLSAHLHTDLRSGLQLGVRAIAPNGRVLSTSLAELDGDDIHLAAVKAAVSGEYRLEVFSINEAPGQYQIKPMINADVENEFYVLGTPNNSPEQAYDIDSAFIDISSSRAEGSQASVFGSDFNKSLNFVDYFGFDTSDDGFTVDNTSAYEDLGLWHRTTRRGFVSEELSDYSFYYGNDETGNYETPGPNAGSITSRPIKLVPHGLLELRFNYVLQNENSLDFDEASVSVSNDGGVTFTKIISSALGQLPLVDDWQEATFDLTPYAGQTIQLRFSFDTLDAVENQYEGWYVDDVTIVNDDDWSDYYSFTANAGQRIEMTVTSTGGNPVTVDIENELGEVLMAGVASSVFTSQATGFVADTTGTYYARVHGEFETSYELLVTRDILLESTPNKTAATASPLQSRLTTIGYVAAENTQSLDFESGAQGVVINNESVGSGVSAGLWHLTTRRGDQAGHSGPTSFYYGDEATGTYNTGARNAGSLTTGEFAVPAVNSTLSFNYVLRTQGQSTVDRATVLISTDNFATSQLIILGGTANMIFSNTWRSTSVSLASYAGRNIRVRFNFDTVNALNNGFEGWYVDDITVGNGPQADWHSITLGPDNNALSVQLRAPWQESEFANSLVAQLDLYDHSGTVLLASAVADGNGLVNLSQDGLISEDTYLIKVSASAGTRGEYQLDVLTLRDPVITSQVDDTPSKIRQADGWFEVPKDYDKGWKSVVDTQAYQGDYTIHSHRSNSGGGNYAEWSILATSSSPELFVSWIALPGNATNATYEIYRDSDRLGRVVLDQTKSPDDALIDGVLAESLGAFTIRSWRPGTRLNVRLLTHDANGNVVADGLFDPPTGQQGLATLMATPMVEMPNDTKHTENRGVMPANSSVTLVAAVKETRDGMRLASSFVDQIFGDLALMRFDKLLDEDQGLVSQFAGRYWQTGTRRR